MASSRLQLLSSVKGCLSHRTIHYLIFAAATFFFFNFWLFKMLVLNWSHSLQDCSSRISCFRHDFVFNSGDGLVSCILSHGFCLWQQLSWLLLHSRRSCWIIEYEFWSVAHGSYSSSRDVSKWFALKVVFFFVLLCCVWGVFIWLSRVSLAFVVYLTVLCLLFACVRIVFETCMRSYCVWDVCLCVRIMRACRASFHPSFLWWLFRRSDKYDYSWEWRTVRWR